MRDLVFETHIMEWGNISDQCYQGSKVHCYIYLITLCTAGVNFDHLNMEYMHDEFCDVLLPLGACNNWADTAV
jgi:hypothetical protein